MKFNLQMIELKNLNQKSYKLIINSKANEQVLCINNNTNEPKNQALYEVLNVKFKLFFGEI